jgi:predicted transcriptional regulator
MAMSGKASAILAASALIVGLLIGFIPAHLNSSSLNHDNKLLQADLVSTRTQLTLSNFTVQSAKLYTEAAKNNFSIASANASNFFTELRKYIDQSNDETLKKQLEAVMAKRDGIIAGLAKADPAVTTQVQDTFLAMQQISSARSNNH